MKSAIQTTSSGKHNSDARQSITQNPKLDQVARSKGYWGVFKSQQIHQRQANCIAGNNSESPRKMRVIPLNVQSNIQKGVRKTNIDKQGSLSPSKEGAAAREIMQNNTLTTTYSQHESDSLFNQASAATQGSSSDEQQTTTTRTVLNLFQAAAAAVSRTEAQSSVLKAGYSRKSEYCFDKEPSAS